ncbi:metal-dependent phosphohydrolase [Streptomyces sp. NPDC047022]|uniref:metal-dependent phosphohydrolase n=1 Tax=Streptomyces sp. NPDC047022 TaxID=3155737 RepID=UPI0033C808F5
MELRSVEELMDLLHACRGARSDPGGGDPVDPYEHALRTAALLRRSRPADKELQVAGLVHGIGRLLASGDRDGQADRAADAVRPLFGARVSGLVRLHGAARRYLVSQQAAFAPGHMPRAHGSRVPARQEAPMTPAEAAAFERDPLADDAVALRQAHEAANEAGMNGGVLEDWRTVLEMLASRQVPLGAVD